MKIPFSPPDLLLGDVADIVRQSIGIKYIQIKGIWSCRSGTAEC